LLRFGIGVHCFLALWSSLGRRTSCLVNTAPQVAGVLGRSNVHGLEDMPHSTLGFPPLCIRCTLGGTRVALCMVSAGPRDLRSVPPRAAPLKQVCGARLPVQVAVRFAGVRDSRESPCTVWCQHRDGVVLRCRVAQTALSQRRGASDVVPGETHSCVFVVDQLGGVRLLRLQLVGLTVATNVVGAMRRRVLRSARFLKATDTGLQEH